MTTAPGRPEPESESDGMPPGVAPGNEPAGAAETLPSRWPETLPPDIAALALQTFVVPANSENAVTLDLTDAQTDRLIDQMGRQSDQAHNLHKWMIVFAAFLVLVMAGIIVFMLASGNSSLVGEFIFGIGGFFGGLAAGVGGGYSYANRRR